MNPESQLQIHGAARYRAPALEKGLDILELLADTPQGMTQSEIARALERSVGEIFRMLNCLVERGYLAIQKPGERYILTLKLFELAHRNPPVHRMLTDATPLMHELANRVHQSVHLTVIEGGHGVVIAQADSPGHLGFAVRVGSIVNLLSTASGRVLLAFQTHEDRSRVLSRPGAHQLEQDELARTHAMLDMLAKRGYEEMDSTRVRGVHDLSFPVLNHRGAAVAAMTIPFIERLDAHVDPSLAAARQALADTAARLSGAIGGTANSHFDPTKLRTSRRR